MKHLLIFALLLAGLAPAATIRDSFGFEVNVISFEPVMEPVVYTDTPGWADLPGMQHYWELLIARVFGDDSYLYNFTFRMVTTQIALNPPHNESWVEFVKIGQQDDGPATPEPDTLILFATGALLLYAGGSRWHAATPADKRRHGRHAWRSCFASPASTAASAAPAAAQQGTSFPARKGVMAPS